MLRASRWMLQTSTRRPVLTSARYQSFTSATSAVGSTPPAAPGKGSLGGRGCRTLPRSRPAPHTCCTAPGEPPADWWRWVRPGGTVRKAPAKQDENKAKICDE
eukprot:6482786-Pyramimonas_sp.AAC.1